MPSGVLSPAIERDRVLQPNWILWPHARDPLGRLLPMTTGVDWDLRADSFSVQSRGDEFALLESVGLERRGFFAARRALLGDRPLRPLARPGGALPVEAIALCADGSGPVRPVTARELRDPRTVVVAFAPTGDDVIRAQRAVTGRILMIETPLAGREWSRFYLQGQGWPADRTPVPGGVPGLVPAREAGRLLDRPGTFVWTPHAPLLYREADRWLGPARSEVATWGLVLLSLGALGVALLDLAADRRRLLAGLSTRAALATPGAVLLSPIVSNAIGPEFAPLSAVVLVLALLGLVQVTARFFGERGAIALLSAIGVAAAGWAGPLHPWSGVLRDLPGGLSPEAVGAAALYASVGIGATRDGEGPLWLLVRFANIAALVGLGLHAPLGAFAMPLGWAAGMGTLPLSVVPAIAALPDGLARLLTGGIDYRPDDLAREAPVTAVVNLWRAAALFVSVPVLLFGAAIGIAAMTAAPYAGYRLRRAERGPGHAALTVAGALAAASLLSPELWPAVLVALAGGLPLLVADARLAG